MLRRLPQTPRRLLRRGRGALNVLLMSVPPVFNIALVSLLSYYTVHHNNVSATHHSVFTNSETTNPELSALTCSWHKKRTKPQIHQFWYFVMKCHLVMRKQNLFWPNFHGLLNKTTTTNRCHLVFLTPFTNILIHNYSSYIY